MDNYLTTITMYFIAIPPMPRPQNEGKNNEISAPFDYTIFSSNNIDKYNKLACHHEKYTLFNL